MIPLPLLMGQIPWRLVGAGALVVAVGVMGWRVSAWHEAYKALPDVQAALEAEVACADGSKCSDRQRAFTEAVGHETVRIVSGYESELADLRSRPARVVRLCPDARSGDVRRAGTAAGPDGAGPAAGFVSGPAGPDIGQELYGLAQDADEVAARLRALQEFNRAISAAAE